MAGASPLSRHPIYPLSLYGHCGQCIHYSRNARGVHKAEIQEKELKLLLCQVYIYI